MHVKQRQLPLEVSSWMQKDVSLHKLNTASRMMSNDNRQNVVLSRQFFAKTLNLSFARYRSMVKSDFDKKLFLKNQRNKAETTLPGLRPYCDQALIDLNRGSPSRMSPTRKDGDSFLSSSSQSLLTHSIIKSDQAMTSSRGPTPGTARSIKTPQPLKFRAKIAPPPPPLSSSTTPISTTPTSRSPSSRQKMSRERLSRLAQPKSQFAPRTLDVHMRSNTSKTPINTHDVFGKIDEVSEVSSAMQKTESSPAPVKSACSDKRFQRLMHIFTESYDRTASARPTVQSIISSNTSLQDDEGRWQMTGTANTARLNEIENRRRKLAAQFTTQPDFFWIDVGS